MSSYYQNKSILVTGATGFVGSHLCQSLTQAQAEVITLSRAASHNANHISADIAKYTTSDWLSVLNGVDIIFHLAAQTSIYAAQQNPLADFDMNVVATVRLLQAATQCKNPPIIILAGTVTQCGLTTNLPVDETHHDQPITFYDVSKLAAEQYLKQYIRDLGLKGCCLRLANVYGPSVQTHHQAERGVISKVIQKALNGEDIPLYGGGAFIRDYIYISDVIEAFMRAPAHIDATTGKHFFIAGGHGHTLKTVFSIIVELCNTISGKTAQLIDTPMPESLSPIEHRNFFADTSSFQNAAHWQPKIALKQGLQLTVNSLKGR